MNGYGAFDIEEEKAPLLQEEDVENVIASDEEVVDGEDDGEALLGPPGVKLKRNSQIEYNPYDWYKTLFVVDGRTYVSRSFYVICAIGTILVILSGIGGIGLETERECRAWCSRLALGTQPHSYMGFILFLLMAFRTKESYKMYAAGQRAHFRIKLALRRFVDAMLNQTARDAILPEHRARLLAFSVVFPYTLTADLRHERKYDRYTVESMLSRSDLAAMISAPSMPLYVLESLTIMVRLYCEKGCEAHVVRKMYGTLEQLYEPYGECERIKQNRFAFAYVAHLRLLLVTYLVTLPLALVEQMGYSTIAVVWVICYSLMSLEMLAVEVENPFGHGRSDLRLHEFNELIKDSLMESWERWQQNLEAATDSEDVQAGYAEFRSDIAGASYSADNYW